MYASARGQVKPEVSDNFIVFKKYIPHHGVNAHSTTNQVNLPKSEFLAGKNLKKVIAAGEGRAQRNLQKLLDRRPGTSRRNPEKTGIPGFF
jgi:hypothetical protein